MAAISHRALWRLTNRPLFRRRAAEASALGVSPILAALIVDARRHIAALSAHDVVHEEARLRWLGSGRQYAPFAAISDENDRLCALLYDVENAITAHPVATMPDLVAMLDYMESRGMVADDDCLAALVAGIRRVAAKGRLA